MSDETETADRLGGLSAAVAIPDGVVVSDALPQTPQWFAQRAAGITATDIPKILGLSSYGNALSVWADKRGEIGRDDAAGEAAEWGTILEPVVADKWAARNGAVIDTVGTVASRDHPWRLASLDRLVFGCPEGDGPCPLEVKTRSAFVAGRWSEDIPDDVLAQVTWQMAVTGFGHSHVAVLLGGQQFRQFRVDRDPSLEAFVVAEADRVWGHVLDGTPPAVEAGDLLARILDQIFTSRDGVTAVPLGELAGLIADYDAAHEAEKVAKDAKAAARARLIKAMGAGEALTADGLDEPAVTYKESTRRAYTVAEAKGRSLRITAAYRKAMNH